MREYTSFRAGGCAKRLIVCENDKELADILTQLCVTGEPHVFLGNGTNTLFMDGLYEGAVVMLGDHFKTIEITEDNNEEGAAYLRCGAAALLSKIAKAAVANSLTGMEFAAGIPGSAGGALFMNAGAYGGEMKDIVASATLLVPATGKHGYEVKNVTGEELGLSYRHSRLQESGEIALFVTYKLKKGNPEEIESRMSELALKRRTKQPLEYPSAGSFFKRPEGYFAGKLIEDSGLRGVGTGGAQVSEKHCGFIINRGNATTQDILDLMKIVQNTVFDNTGVSLEPEVRIIGK